MRQIKEDCLKEVILDLNLELLWCCLVTLFCPTFCDPMECGLPGSSVHGISRQEYWVGCHFLLQESFLTRDAIWLSCKSSALQADSLLLSPHQEAPEINYSLFWSFVIANYGIQMRLFWELTANRHTGHDRTFWSL